MRTRIKFKKNVALVDSTAILLAFYMNNNSIKQKINILNLRLEKYVLLICLENLLHTMAQKRYLETSMFGL